MDREGLLHRTAIPCGDDGNRNRSVRHRGRRDSTGRAATAIVTYPISGLEDAMADDKTKRGGADRSKVAAGETYELSAFAAKHGLSLDDARTLIKQVGNDRATLDKAAAAFKKANRRYTM